MFRVDKIYSKDVIINLLKLAEIYKVKIVRDIKKNNKTSVVEDHIHLRL